MKGQRSTTEQKIQIYLEVDGGEIIVH